MPLPTLPGELILGEHAYFLRTEVARLLRLESPNRFPGSQPVSFKSKDVQRLENEDYWVCEKSDGIRVLFFIMLIEESNEQEVYLIDRKNDYRRVTGLYFPHYEDPRKGLRNTLLDGELVVDVDPGTKRETIRLLAFDCIAVDGHSVMQKSLTSRYGKLQAWVVKPFEKMTREYPDIAAHLPFDIKVKRMERAYSIEMILNEVIPKLQHAHDGLIFTNANSGYVVGTDPSILKWKPPSENSVDFKLDLRFPPFRGHVTEGLDYYAKPTFVLLAWCGGAKYEFFDTMQVSDEEWEKMKESEEQYDDRVVEVVWDFEQRNWKILRFRDDKKDGNHKSVVENVLESIMDGVEVETLIKAAPDIRAMWKRREKESREQQGAPPPPPSQGPARPNGPPASMPITHSPQYLRYTPMLPSQYTKVGGPPMVAGMSR
ncbi:Dcp1p-Dcp2p decapping enzyme complex alpha subunit [Tulasnella sp. 418]|nr:Dcp1p-Dcp2p decapping enzyme complex alpha subunit [Tulasnella sp. 418]